MKNFKPLLVCLLLLGIVDQINDDIITVEYLKHGKLQHSKVSLSQSACTPLEGQKVYFFEGYKVVTCEESLSANSET